MKKMLYITITILILFSSIACDKEGQDQVEYGEESYIAFKEDGLYGFMLPTGKVVVEAKYDHVEPFRYGHALVAKDWEFTYIDSSGNEFDEWYDYNVNSYRGYMQFTSDGLAPIVREHSIISYIDSDENIILNKNNVFPFTSENSTYIKSGAYFEDGLIPAHTIEDDNTNFNGCLYLDQSGQVALQDNYIQCSSFSDGLAAVEIIEGQAFTDSYYHGFAFINSSGDYILKTDLTSVYKMFDGIQTVLFKDGYAIGEIKPYLGSEENVKYVVIDDQGHVVLDFEAILNNDTLYYEMPVDVSGNYVLTKNQDDYYAIYDLDGQLILGYIYEAGLPSESVRGIFDERLVLKNDDNQYGAVNVRNGQVVIDFEYDFMSAFSGGYAVVEKDDLFGVIDIFGQIVIDLTYEDMFMVTRTYVDDKWFR